MASTKPHKSDENLPDQQRMPAAEVLQRMLAAGREMVDEQGVQVSLEDLTYDKVIERAGVPRSSAYHMWRTKSEYLRDLILHLAESARRATEADAQRTINTVRDLVMKNITKLGDPDERRRVLLEGVRTGVRQSFETIVDSNEWYIYLALTAGARSAGNDQNRLKIAGALLEGQKKLIEYFADLYGQMLGVLKYRPRNDAYTVRHLAVAGAAIVEGLAMRHFLPRAIDRADEPPPVEDRGWTLASLFENGLPGPSPKGDITGDGWSLAAIAYLGIVDALFEPIPPQDIDEE
jgi:AcrR family transcriptional regulator